MKSQAVSSFNEQNIPVKPFEVLKAQIENSHVAHWFHNVSDLIKHSDKHHKVFRNDQMRSRVLIFPGQFDPFHVSHFKEVTTVLDVLGIEKGFLVPTRGSPGRPTFHAPDWLRMLVVKRFSTLDKRVNTDVLGLRNNISAAPELISAYREKFGKSAEIVLLMGSDNLLGLKNWDNVENLLKNANIIVNSRPGFNIGNLLEVLPKNLQKEYYYDFRQTILHKKWGTWIRFIDLPVEEHSSHEVIEAIKKHDDEAVDKLMSPAGAFLVKKYHYAKIDYEKLKRDYAFSQAVLPSLKKYLDTNLANKLAADKIFLHKLNDIDPSQEGSLAKLATLIFQMVKSYKISIQKYPLLYSQVVALGLDTSFLNALESIHCTEKPKQHKIKGRLKNNTSEQISSANILNKKRKHPAFDIIDIINRIGITVLQKACSNEIKNRAGEVKLAVKSAPLAERNMLKGKTIRVYTGVGSNVDIEQILKNGMLSTAERNIGKQYVQQKIAELGDAEALIYSTFSHYNKNEVLYVSSSLSPEVAKSYAKSGGFVFVADVPADAGVFMNDPEIWSNTPFRHVGCPEQVVHEFTLKQIKPEWITEVRKVDTKPNIGFEKSVITQIRRALLPILKTLTQKDIK